MFFARRGAQQFFSQGVLGHRRIIGISGRSPRQFLSTNVDTYRWNHFGSITTRLGSQCVGKVTSRAMSTKVTTHESLKIVNTTQAPAAIGPYSQAIKTMEIVQGGVEEQTKQALKNFKAVVEASGSELGKVAKTTVFLKNMNDFAAVNAVYAEFFGDHKPARSAVEVARLPKDVLVEVEAIVSLA
ncbi:hypothetical protein Agabi119p4_121 [Agaricus bisporus var. burnettii]|uniref:Uncharacterized protein n=1 Tax=Agaricus bisporus var. burnettii TaxID=192524 RepID=A0A8H7KKM7_AGABI|nr:hypothetical protein Agabi119p4_121 [Agaricus bisporus var. burnettii]